MAVEMPQQKLEGFTFKMDKETYEEMISTLMNVMSSDDDGTLIELADREIDTQQNLKDMDDDLYGTDEPGKPGTLLAATEEAQKQNVPTDATEPKPTMVSVECQAGTTNMRPPMPGGPNDPYKCLQCPRTFTDIDDYNSHVFLHMRMHESRYICNICNMRFRNFDRIALHLNSTHEQDRVYNCFFCHQTFGSQRELNNHKRAHHAVRHRLDPVFNPRFHNLMTLLRTGSAGRNEREEVLTNPNRFHEARSRTNAGQGYRSRSGNAGTSNAGTRNAGTRNAGPRNVGTRNAVPRNVGARNSGPRNAGPRNAGPRNAGPRNVGTRNAVPSYAGTRNAGTRNAWPRNAGTRNAGNANAGTRNAGNANAGTRNPVTRNPGSRDVGTRNVETINAGTSNARTSNAGTANADVNKLETVNLDLANPGIMEIINVDIDSVVNEGADNVEIIQLDLDNMGAVNVEIASAGTANAGSANAGTDNGETANNGTTNAGASNAETTNEEIAADDTL